MPRSGHQKPIWSSGKAELGACEPGSVSVCAAERALRGEAVVSRNKIPSGSSPRTVGAASGQTGEIIAKSTERRWVMLAYTEISWFFGLKKKMYMCYAFTHSMRWIQKSLF